MKADRHGLVVGGSGMLRGVVLELAARGWDVSVVARRPGPLRALVDEAASHPGAVHPLPLDYRDTEHLVAEARRAQNQRGPLTLVVAWIHGTAPDAPEALAELVGGQPPTCRYVELVGSASRDPSTLHLDRADRMRALSHLAYRRVVLGHVEAADGARRWLTDGEISDGVIAAIDADAEHHIIGVTG